MSNWFEREQLEYFKRNQGENLPPGGRRLQEDNWLGEKLKMWDKAGWRFLLVIFLSTLIISIASEYLAQWFTNQAINFNAIAVGGLIVAVFSTLLFCAVIYIRFLLRKRKMRAKRHTGWETYSSR